MAQMKQEKRITKPLLQVIETPLATQKRNGNGKSVFLKQVHEKFSFGNFNR